MNVRTCLVAMLCLAALSTNVMAQGYSWCYTNYPDAIYCDDFDRYCNASPYPPYPCAPGTWSIARLRATWDPIYTPLDAGGCSEAWLEDGWPYDPVPMNGVVSSPFSIKFPNQADAKVGINVKDLTPDIQRKWGSQVFYAVGTDEHPLQLDYTFWGQTVASKTQAANVFMELANDTDFAMTNFVWGPTSPTTGKQYPILCAQGTGEPDGCPPLSTAPLRASICVGAVSFLDRDYLNSPDQTPKTPYLCVYDGRFWWQLRSGQFPNGEGAFTLHEREHYIRLTIWGTHMKVEMTVPKYGQYSWADIPRQYQGGFNTMRIGFGKNCQISAATGWLACQSNFRCPLGSYGAGAPAFDNVVLYGGDPLRAPYIITQPVPQGVPARSTATFTVTAGGTTPLNYQWQKNYINLSNTGHYSGVTTPTLTISNVDGNDVANYRCMVTNMYGSTASEQAALSLVAAKGDFDMDGDADLEDFAFFQSCFNGPNRPARWGGCSDADSDDDNDVDLGDFAAFQACFNGPNRAPRC
ncbi:MAG: immunoglobulin domain-containing protein [Phycisphaerae bacterium]